MTTASEYARIFRAAADGALNGRYRDMKPGVMYHVDQHEEAYSKVVGNTFRAIADMFDKIAETEGPTTSGTNSGNCEHKGTSYSNTLGTFCGDCHERI